MYAKVRSVSKLEEINSVCAIEVGLSSGIPLIRYIGKVSSQLSMTKEKIPFIFSYLGRKLPNRKIRVNFSSEKLISSSHTDLAVTTALYLAAHDLHPDKDIWCVGELEMDGNILPVKNIARTLFTIKMQHNGSQSVLFTPSITTKLMSFYPEIEIVKVKNLIDIFDYFEGKIGNKERSEKHNNSASVQFNYLPRQVQPFAVGLIGGFGQLSLYERQVQKGHHIDKFLQNYAHLLFDNSAMIFNSLISDFDLEEYNNYIEDSDLKEIVNIKKQTEDLFKFRRMILWINDIKKFVALGYGRPDNFKELQRHFTLTIQCSTCLCDFAECRCSTQDIHRYRLILKDLMREVEIVNLSDELACELGLITNSKSYKLSRDLSKSKEKPIDFQSLDLNRSLEKILINKAEADRFSQDMNLIKGKLLEAL